MARSAPGSLRRRLVRWATLSTLATVGLGAFLSYRQARSDVQELIDALMTEAAQLALAQAGEGGMRAQGTTMPAGSLGAGQPRRSELALEVRVGRSDGSVLLRTPGAPESSLAGPTGFADITHRGTGWRRLVAESPDRTVRVEVALPHEARDDEALEIAARAILPMVAALPLLVGLLYLSVRRGLKPLDDLATDVASRSPGNLSALAAVATPPEVRPLVEALNRLFGRVHAALDAERRFTADAAHELRTPLAALKVHTQLALASNPPPATREALAKVLSGVTRTTRLVEGLLRLARLDPMDRLEPVQTVDLGAVALAAVDDARAQAGPARRTLHVAVPDKEVSVTGDADLLGAAVRNLIDNAVRYSPPGGRVEVRVERGNDGPAIVVSDSGPGVAPEELPRLSERFFRGSDPGADGSGLGLAIVRRIVELHEAALEFVNRPGGGFVARIAWPRR